MACAQDASFSSYLRPSLLYDESDEGISFEQRDRARLNVAVLQQASRIKYRGVELSNYTSFYLCYGPLFIRYYNVSLGLLRSIALRGQPWRMTCLFIKEYFERSQP